MSNKKPKLPSPVGAVDLVELKKAKKAIAEKACLDYLSQALDYIRKAGNYQEVKEILSRAEAIRVFAQQMRLADEIEGEAFNVKAVAKRKMGELEETRVKNRGGRKPKTGPTPPTGIPTNRELGIDRHKTKEYRDYASIPEPQFQEALSLPIKQRPKALRRLLPPKGVSPFEYERDFAFGYRKAILLRIYFEQVAHFVESHGVSVGPNPDGVVITKFKGHPILNLPTGRPSGPFDFGLSKARVALKFREAIDKFIKDNDAFYEGIPESEREFNKF